MATAHAKRSPTRFPNVDGTSARNAVRWTCCRTDTGHTLRIPYRVPSGFHLRTLQVGRKFVRSHNARRRTIGIDQCGHVRCRCAIVIVRIGCCYRRKYVAAGESFLSPSFNLKFLMSFIRCIAGLPRTLEPWFGAPCTIQHPSEDDLRQWLCRTTLWLMDRWFDFGQYWHVPADVDLRTGIRRVRQGTSRTQMPINPNFFFLLYFSCE